jgi:hypothetical protein
LNGFGPLSAVSSSNELVTIKPHKPANVPRRGSTTDQTQVEVEWDALTAPNNGGETITSYHLVWDLGTGTANQEVVGFTTPFLSLSHVISTSITAGTSYKFKYRAQNVLGWGDYSDEVTIKAAKEPDAVATPTTIVENTFVKISWTYPTDNFDTVTEYEILIQQDDGTFSASS